MRRGMSVQNGSATSGRRPPVSRLPVVTLQRMTPAKAGAAGFTFGESRNVSHGAVVTQLSDGVGSTCDASSYDDTHHAYVSTRARPWLNFKGKMLYSLNTYALTKRPSRCTL
jgi:hypothetical protein